MKTTSSLIAPLRARPGGAARPVRRVLLLATLLAFGIARTPAQDTNAAVAPATPGQATTPADATQAAPAGGSQMPAGMAAALAEMAARKAGGATNAAASTGDVGTATAPVDPSAITLSTATTGTGGTNGFNLNFRNAQIESVLSYLSDAAGFIIEVDSRVSGTITVMGKNLTRDEAVELLDSQLNRTGYTAIRSGDRYLKIMDKRSAQSANNRVVVGNEPTNVPDNDEMVTQIIPIRFVEAQQLVSDLSPFVSSDARIIANQAGNSIVVTDTQSNIRHLMEIIKDIDSSAEDVTELRVFHLDHADCTETANLLSSLFPDSSNGGAQSPLVFGGGRGGRGGGGGGRGGGGGFGFNPFAAAFGGGAAGGNGQNDRIKKRQQVVAVPDPRSSSVIVTATKDLMEQIAEVIDRLDHQSPKEMSARVFHMDHADVQAILPILQQMFPSTSANRTGQTGGSQTSPFQTRLQQYEQNSSSSSSVLGGSTLGGGGLGGGGGGGRGGF
jgi:type II secretory pathway component GspD/PulD (secretin)